MPSGSWLAWSGQFEHLVAARQRLSLVVPEPLATVVIGGLVSSTLLTLVVLPALYTLLAPSEAARDVPRPHGGALL